MDYNRGFIAGRFNTSFRKWWSYDKSWKILRWVWWTRNL